MQKETLNKVFQGLKIDATCVNAYSHRHFSFYDVELNPKCKVSKIRHYADEIALGLRSKTTPIIKIIPEKGIVRLQTITTDPSTLYFEDLLAASHKQIIGLNFLFGETNEGNLLWVDMKKNPHMLVAGSTGSGKSVFLHTLIANALRDETCSISLVDPKGSEFINYKEIADDLCVSYTDTVDMLKRSINEMEYRYKELARCNKISVEGHYAGIFGYKLIIIDEVSDLMLQDKSKEFEESVLKLAQKSRAVGIHLVLATQRPSVDVLTGLIKANFPSRLAFKVSSRVDSNVILDTQGAEYLIGRGDGILATNEYDYVRCQIAMSDPKVTAKIQD